MRPLAAYLAMRLKARLAYRGDLLVAAAGDVLVATVGLAAVGVLFHHTDTLGGFGVWEVLLGWGLAQTSLGVFWTLFPGLYALNRQYLLQGELDRVLLRPLDPYLQVMLDHVNPGGLLLSAVGLGVFLWAAAASGLAWSVGMVLLFPVIVLCGTLLVAGVLTATAALGFWMHHEGSAVGLVYQFAGFAPYPLTILPRPFAFLVTAVLPFAFVGFLPATLYMDRPAWWPLAIAQPLVGLVVFFLGWGFWRFSLRRYGSAGH